MPVHNVSVGRSGEQYSLSWSWKQDHYHVWLRIPSLEVTPAIGSGRGYPAVYKTVPPTDKHPRTGRYRNEVRYLDARIAKNKAMVEDAMAQAEAGRLFEKCERKLAQEEKERLAQAAAEYKVRLAKEAGPQMLIVLKAISKFWQEGGNIHPLSPGALLLEGEETIADAVKLAIIMAETGGAVQL
jgi:hypothetical protein